MRLNTVVPRVALDVITLSSGCAYGGCGGHVSFGAADHPQKWRMPSSGPYPST